MKSLSQFQALQGKETELANLRDLGLTDAEIKLWKKRDIPEAVSSASEKVTLVVTLVILLCNDWKVKVCYGPKSCYVLVDKKFICTC